MFRHGTDDHGALAGIAWWWLIRLLHVFDLDTVTDVAVSYGKSFLGVFCWAWPRSSCCFVALETKRKSGWGICGSSLFVFLRFCVMICPFTGTGQLSCVPPFSPLMSLSGPCHRAFTAKLEEKKKQRIKRPKQN